MKMVQITPHEFNCPDCLEPLGEEVLMELMGEPFNGIYYTCGNCGSGLTMDVIIKIVVDEEMKDGSEVHSHSG